MIAVVWRDGAPLTGVTVYESEERAWEAIQSVLGYTGKLPETFEDFQEQELDDASDFADDLALFELTEDEEGVWSG